ncbi:MAG: DNA cytosine methyltransferase [Planctomycetes bacterium]|nr:DNA cytosine methyltransferase [Planctomycetota bacterium]
MAEPTVISLYSGVGGLDYGLEQAGFRTLVAVELDHDCCETLRHNGRGWKVIERDIARVSSDRIVAEAGVDDVDLLVGGPPCQPFSKSAWGVVDSRGMDDPRATTVKSLMRVLERVKPRAFLIENVEGFAYAGQDEGLSLVRSRLRSINKKHGTRYEAHVAVLDAAEHGAPQFRRRFFAVGARDGTAFEFPKPTFGEGDGLTAYRTAWDAIGDLEDTDDPELAAAGKWNTLLPSIPEGSNYLFHTNRGGGLPLFGWRTRFWTFLLKLAKAQPSWTITAQPGPSTGPFHWKNRRLSLLEMRRLQTLPEGFDIKGERLSAQRQVGNAVPSLLGEVLGREIRVQLLGLPKIEGALKLLPAVRSPCPRATPRRPVPPEHLHLLNEEHPDHPGPGKGPGALRRRKQRLAAGG